MAKEPTPEMPLRWWQQGKQWYTIDCDGDLSDGEKMRPEAMAPIPPDFHFLSEARLSWRPPLTPAWTIKAGRPGLPNTASLIESGRPVPRYLW